jgi:hypothetical protein
VVFDGVVGAENYLKITGLKRVWKCRSICFGGFCVPRTVVFLLPHSTASYSPTDSTDCAIYFTFYRYLSLHCFPDLPTTLYFCFISVLTNGQFLRPT